MFSTPNELALDVLLSLNNTVATLAILPAPIALAEDVLFSPNNTVDTEAILAPAPPDSALTVLP
ncbi:hypothetical protein, partial [Mycobacterium pseudoshottsii]|uniref:hypothetical protein n=1 Tax=Mycobacterium pseudoshottsii TaxID=265949 RepID=UPI001F45DD4F